MTRPTYCAAMARAHHARTVSNAIARGRAAASDAMCRANAETDMRAALVIFAAVFTFLVLL